MSVPFAFQPAVVQLVPAEVFSSRLARVSLPSASGPFPRDSAVARSVFFFFSSLPSFVWCVRVRDWHHGFSVWFSRL